MPPPPSSDTALLLFAFVIGSAATLIPKVLLRSPCASLCGEASAADSSFGAPLFAASIVFAAAILGLAAETVLLCMRSRAQAATRAAPWLAEAARRLALPALLATGSLLLQLYALRFISAGVMAGLRGLLILFTAWLGAFLGLKDRPASRAEWACIGASAAGALCVALGAAVSADGGSGEGGSPAGTSPLAAALLGAGASAAGYLLAAGQVSAEQLLLEGAAPLSKWQILGVEGWLGMAMIGGGAAVLSTPAARGWAPSLALEDPTRTLCCLQHTPVLPALSAAYGASSLAFNAALLALGARVGPNARVFVFSARGVLSWGAELGMHYGAWQAAQPFGESAEPASAAVAAGYVLLIASGLWRVRLQARAKAGASGDEKGEGVCDPLLEGEISGGWAGEEPGD